MRTDDVRDFLVLTDSESSDVSALYPVEEAVADSDTVSVPLPFSTGDMGTLQFSTDADVDVDVLWAGSLSFPSGTVLVTNGSMRRLRQHLLAPGTYDVTVFASSKASDQRDLIISLVRAT